MGNLEQTSPRLDGEWTARFNHGHSASWRLAKSFNMTATTDSFVIHAS